MSDSLERHLVALLALVEDMFVRAEQAAVQGKSPSGSGQRLTPLPPERWEEIRKGLDQMEADLRSVAEAIAPAALAEYAAAEPEQTTYYWLRLLVNGLRDNVVAALDPEHIQRRYGEVSAEHTELLMLVHQRIQNRLATVESALSRRDGYGD